VKLKDPVFSEHGLEEFLKKTKAKNVVEAFHIARGKTSNETIYQVMREAIEEIEKEYDSSLETSFTEAQLKEKNKLDQMEVNSVDTILEWQKGWIRLIRLVKKDIVLSNW